MGVTQELLETVESVRGRTEKRATQTRPGSPLVEYGVPHQQAGQYLGETRWDIPISWCASSVRFTKDFIGDQPKRG